MTLYSKANLVVGQVSSKDEFDRGLNGVRFEPDGSTAAGNGKVLLAVEGVKDPKTLRAYPDVGERTTPGDQGFVLTPNHVEEALQNIPKDKRPVMQHCAMTKGHDDAAMVELTTVSVEGRERRVADRPKVDRYPDWRAVVRKVVEVEEGKEVVRVCVNRSDLLMLLKAMESACPDKGNDCPVYLEIGKGIVLRSVNRITQQHAIGAISAYNTRGNWIDSTPWTQGIFEEESPRKPMPKRIKRG